ncbi:hypothetical protein [Ruminococcus sp.]|uniref:hypothetical protein n=1 Tax=Ruminococcus sp. TaxID=41978 RepID=UPI0025F3E0F8|nr:hypothetical protein [Ruminococcus sp.]MBQ8967248.1 hypothetical protein [Ruminococcus sp.]
MSNINDIPELERGEYTETIYGDTCSDEPANSENAEDIVRGIELAMKLETRPVFLEGAAARLTQLGVPCKAEDTQLILAEVRRRFNDKLGISCPKAVENWCRGGNTGVTNRKNNYDLCYALEMDYDETAVFFQKTYLTIPFIVKSKEDAVFMYCLYHKRPYSVVKGLLEKSKGFVSQEKAHTSTAQIRSVILETDDDEKFLRYLSEHCYDKEQQFQLARDLIIKEVNDVKEILQKYEKDRILSAKRLNSMTIEALLGYKYQRSDKKLKDSGLPKRFTESLPNDATLGDIINGNRASYELLRKTLMLLKFYNFYFGADNDSRESVRANLMDLRGELNYALNSCGFARLYVCHPFDCLLLYCANSFDPIDTLYCVIQNGQNPFL